MITCEGFDIGWGGVDTGELRGVRSVSREDRRPSAPPSPPPLPCVCAARALLLVDVRAWCVSVLLIIR